MSSIIRVLFIGDNHIDDRIKTRSDDYLASGLAELDECFEIAQDAKCDACVFLGDIFNRITISTKGMNKVLAAFLKPQPFRKLVCVGNHDIDHNMAFLERSHLHTLLLSEGLEMHDYVPELGMAFAHFHDDLLERIENGMFEQVAAPVWVAHASIATRPIFGSHILFDDLLVHEKTKLVVAGHVHLPMSAERADGVMFVNPGNVGRNAASQENLTRQIKVALIEYDLSGTIHSVKYIPLRSALPARDVFYLDLIQEEKAKMRAAQNFVKQVNQFQIRGNTGNRDEMIALAAKEAHLPDEVLERVQAVLAEVRKKTGD